MWARFTVSNQSSRDINWFLDLGNPYMDYIDLYFPTKSGSFTVKQAGQRRRFSSRDIDYRIPVFSLIEAPNSQRTFYLRLQNEDPTYYEPVLRLKDGLIKKISEDQAILGISYGILIAMLIYNFCIAWSAREKAYLWYSLVIITLICISL